MSSMHLNQESAKMMAELITDIAAEREKQGLSQSTLSELAGIKQSALSRMESLKAFPQLDTLCKILQPLNLKLMVKSTINKEDNNMKIANGEVKKLIVDTNWCNLNVTASNDGDFHMVTANEDNFTLEKAEDSIIIRQKKRKGLKWLFSWIPTDMKITVPHDFNGETELNNDNGKTHVYSLTLNQLNLKGDNGSVFCEDINAGEVFAHAGNGSIKIHRASFKSFDSHAGNGSIKLTDLVCEGFIKAKTSNGSVVIKNTSGTTFDLKSSNGSVSAEQCDCKKNLSASTSNGGVTVSLTGNECDYAMDFSTANGSIKVGNNKTCGRYIVKSEGIKLEAHTSNGGISFRFADTVDETKTEAFDNEPIVEISEEEIEIINDEPK